MSYTQSERAVQTLHDLQVEPERQVTLTFAETGSLRTAEWATRKFGPQLLVDAAVSAYNKEPALDGQGRPVAPEELGGRQGRGLRYGQEDAHDTAVEIADDLKAAYKRLYRGYQLGQLSVHGVEDTSAIIGSLERAVEVHPDNLSDSEQHFQAAARYMLDHMQVIDADISNSRSLLL